MIGEAIIALGVVVWAVLLVLFLGKWLGHRAEALAEARHPVQCCFIGLVGVSTMLVATALAPYAPSMMLALFVPGAAFTIAFAAWRTGALWQGGLDPASITPVLYLPAVAGSFVTSIGLARFGLPQAAELAFGAGVLSWLALESVIVSRLLTGAPLPPPLRPTLGIQLAPPTVGAAAHLALTGGAPDALAYGLVGYGLLQAVILARLTGFVFAQPFSPGYWAFSFGLTALATDLIVLAQRGGGAVALLGPVALVVVSVLMAGLILRTLALLWSGRLLPTATPR